MRAVIAAIRSAVLASLLLLPLAAPPVAAAPGATLVRDIHRTGSSDPWELTRVGARLFFSAVDDIHGRELWATDGTHVGTYRVRDIRPGAGGSSPRGLTRVGSRLYFTANDGTHGRELWVTDGTRAGTRMVKDLTEGSRGSNVHLGGIVDLAGTAVFATGTGLYRTDGTAAGTRLIRSFDQVSPLDPSMPWRHATVRGATLYFTARDRPRQDDALWRTDGTAAGTRRISQRDLGPFALTRLGRHIFFGATPGLGSSFGADPLPQLWMSDGTRASTRQVGEITDPADLTVLQRRLYFNARRPAATRARLYASDGTAAVTGPVQPRVGPLRHMTRAAGHLWSNITQAEDGEWQPDGLWVSDGTAAGTVLVYGDDDAWVASGEDRLDAVGLGDRLYFAAGPGGPAYDWQLVDHELWTSDGTADGTFEAADIDPDGSSMPESLTRLGDAVYFTATDGVRGRELWRFEPGEALQ